MDDLHTKEDDEGGECPTDVGKRLGKYKSHSTCRERVAAGTALLQNLLS